MRCLLLLVGLSCLASGCAVPATVQVPPPTPRAVAPAGLSVGGAVGTGVKSRFRGSATAVLRPIPNLGVFASGVLARTDSSGDRSSTAYFDGEYREAGVVGAVPLAEGIWATASLAFGSGTVESGGSTLGSCNWFTCSYPRYVLRASAERRSARVGVLFVNVDDLETELGLRIAEVRLTDIERSSGSALSDNDVTLWVAEPSLGARYGLGVGTLDLEVTLSSLLGDVPQDQDLADPRPIYAAESTTVTAGVTLDLASLLGY